MQRFVLELSRIMLLHWRQFILGLQSAMHNGRVHCLKQDDLLISEGWFLHQATTCTQLACACTRRFGDFKHLTTNFSPGHDLYQSLAILRLEIYLQ